MNPNPSKTPVSESGPPSPWHWGFLPLTLFISALPSLASADQIRWWLTSADLRFQLATQPPLEWRTQTNTRADVVEINPDVACQTMLGLGSSLEPSTCSNLWRMSAQDRERVLERLVSVTNGIGMNLMRICIGTPDFTGDPWSSYNDLAAGETDPELKRFTIAKDRAYILPVLKLARQKNPDLLFFASPWSPPGWMKSTGTMIGGHLLPKWYPAYADYFVKFIQAYEAEGIPVYAVTIQNEPGVDRAKEKDPNWFYPSCHWTGEQERDFIRDHLGPAFRRHALRTLIWCYDHNYNVKSRGDDPGLAYPRAILSDPQAAAFVKGVAFHGYAGDPSGMSVFHHEFPEVPLHFTEGSVFGIRGGVELVAKLRHWASSYNAWVTILSEKGQPNNGPFEASRTIITLDSKTRKPTEHFDFFLYGHFMKFIQRGAVRVESSEGPRLISQVAFCNPDRSLVLVVVNSDSKERSVSIRCQDRTTAARLVGRSVATFVWSQS
jgi:glucosylceramidase